jgi:ADP-ribosylglycohydrolase
MSRQAILSSFGRVDKYVNNPRKRNGPGQWTDDTALTLATMDSIITRREIDLADIRAKMEQAYQEDPANGYGSTTIKAFKGEKPNPKRAGNGAAMRIAPVALFSHMRFDKLRKDVTAVSRITHTNPEAIDGALAMAFAVASAVRGELRPSSLIMRTVAYLSPTSEMAYKLREVEDILRDPAMPVEEGLEHIGTRGYVLESVGSAFYAFLKTPRDFRESVVNAVNAGGDTDTVGSLAGAISGAFNGVHGIPRRWLNGLEARAHIEELGQILHFTQQLQLDRPVR